MPALDSNLDTVRAVRSVPSALSVLSASNVVPDAVPAMALLDAPSLNTVLAMLEVIDSAEELALLETLTPEQKRQVWDATPKSTRHRLKQLRNKTAPEVGGVEADGTEPEFAAQPISDLAEAILPADEVESVQPLDIAEPETDSTDLNPLESLDFTPPIKLATGDWVVLQAKPQLSTAELTAIWEVVEIAGTSARIVASKLGIRTYPIAWMLLYPKPIGYVEPEF